MFKKKCPKCNNRVDRKYRFCPFCGRNLKDHDREDYGLLGKDDFDESFNSIFHDITNIPMNRLIKTAMKMTEKMIKDMQKQEFNQPKQPYSNMDIQFFVNGKRVFPEKTAPKTEKPIKIPIRTNLSKEKAEKFAKLPKKEPSSKMRRLGEKLIYEISVPGVKDISDVLINQLENSIEIKALSKNKVYSKTLNINLPIIKYFLEKGNLILELKTE